MIGKTITHLRKKKLITQQQLADELNISRQTISNWETGKSLPDINMVLQISLFFDVSLDILIKGDEQLMKKIRDDAVINQLLGQSIFILIVCFFVSLFSILSLNPLLVHGSRMLMADIPLQIMFIISICFVAVLYFKSFYKESLNMTQKIIHRIIQIIIFISFFITVFSFLLTILTYSGVIVFATGV
ncbi:hypothetical protein NRIC_25370 [Enterococcus florum]|uniref:HTH cro/C1-type domain-containing protein n=1 Tax=Enterococcus florum TaxID=2480627 RepID=A0A4P5PAH1_9ENTE|nr:helix-turn-helix transcriptional regulator [Enterococcus florum]GCF94646.1 hypothetical protein NRIC_25370 [Enterococcus florum]